MNRSWITLVIIAVITLFIIAAYEFVNSLSGVNQDFTKTVSPIDKNLGTNELLFLKGIQGNVLVSDQNLDAANSNGQK